MDDPDLTRLAEASKAARIAWQRQEELLDVSPLSPGEERIMNPEWPERYKDALTASNEFKRLADAYLQDLTRDEKRQPDTP